MVHRPADARLLVSLLTSEKDYHKSLLSLLDSSHAALSSLSAYASASTPPTSHAIIAVAAHLNATDDALRKYAFSVDAWREMLRQLKEVEEDVASIMRDREILVTRLLKATKSDSQKPSRSSLSPTPASPSSSSHTLPLAGPKLTAAQAELQACEATLAERERELDALRVKTVKHGLEARCKALVECAWSWGEMGKEALRALDSIALEIGNGAYEPRASYNHQFFKPLPDPSAPGARASSDTSHSSISPSHSASQMAIADALSDIRQSQAPALPARDQPQQPLQHTFTGNSALSGSSASGAGYTVHGAPAASDPSAMLAPPPPPPHSRITLSDKRRVSVVPEVSEEESGGGSRGSSEISDDDDSRSQTPLAVVENERFKGWGTAGAQEQRRLSTGANGGSLFINRPAAGAVGSPVLSSPRGGTFTHLNAKSPSEHSQGQSTTSSSGSRKRKTSFLGGLKNVFGRRAKSPEKESPKSRSFFGSGNGEVSPSSSGGGWKTRTDANLNRGRGKRRGGGARGGDDSSDDDQEFAGVLVPSASAPVWMEPVTNGQQQKGKLKRGSSKPKRAGKGWESDSGAAPVVRPSLVEQRRGSAIPALETVPRRSSSEVGPSSAPATGPVIIIGPEATTTTKKKPLTREEKKARHASLPVSAGGLSLNLGVPPSLERKGTQQQPSPPATPTTPTGTHVSAPSSASPKGKNTTMVAGVEVPGPSSAAHSKTGRKSRRSASWDLSTAPKAAAVLGISTSKASASTTSLSTTTKSNSQSGLSRNASMSSATSAGSSANGGKRASKPHADPPGQSLMSIVDGLSKQNRDGWNTSMAFGAGKEDEPLARVRTPPTPQITLTNASPNLPASAPASAKPAGQGREASVERRESMRSNGSVRSASPPLALHHPIPGMKPLKSALRQSRTPSPAGAHAPSADIHPPPMPALLAPVAIPATTTATTTAVVAPTASPPESEAPAKDADQASIASYDTGNEVFEDALETPRGTTEDDHGAPPVQYISIPAPGPSAPVAPVSAFSLPSEHVSPVSTVVAAAREGGGSEVSSALTTSSTSTATATANGGAAPTRRKSVRMSLVPTFSPTPPAVDDFPPEGPWGAAEPEDEEDEKPLPVPKKEPNGIAPVTTGWGSRVGNGATKDMWEDSSASEDEEYTRARTMLTGKAKRK